MKINLQKKIEQLKKNTLERQKTIEESQKFGSSLKPVFKRIQ